MAVRRLRSRLRSIGRLQRTRSAPDFSELDFEGIPLESGGTEPLTHGKTRHPKSQFSVKVGSVYEDSASAWISG